MVIMKNRLAVSIQMDFEVDRMEPLFANDQNMKILMNVRIPIMWQQLT